MKKIFDEFKQFILRGNVIDLAIAVVIGAAFTGVVNALVKDLITPLISAIGGKPDFSSLVFTINNSQFQYGDFINSLISFLLIASVVFFLIVKPMNHLISRTKKSDTPSEPMTKKCPECMGEIHIQATRCPFCTAVIKE